MLHEIAGHILLAASNLDVPLATYTIINKILDTNDARALSLPRIRPVLRHLSDVASGGEDPRAMVLQARLLLFSNRDNPAFTMLERAIERYQNIPVVKEEAHKIPAIREVWENQIELEVANMRGASLADAYVALGQINVQRNELLAAEYVFRLAAEQHDHDGAWFELGKLRESHRLLSSDQLSEAVSRIKTANRSPLPNNATANTNLSKKPLTKEKKLGEESEERKEIEEEVEKCFLKAASQGNVSAVESLVTFYDRRYSAYTAANSLLNANPSGSQTKSNPNRLQNRTLSPRSKLQTSTGPNTASRTTSSSSPSSSTTVEQNNKPGKDTPGRDGTWPTEILAMIQQRRKNTRAEKDRLWAQEWSELNKAVSEAVEAAAASESKSSPGSI